jgi:hypothetical protein
VRPVVTAGSTLGSPSPLVMWIDGWGTLYLCKSTLRGFSTWWTGLTKIHYHLIEWCLTVPGSVLRWNQPCWAHRPIPLTRLDMFLGDQELLGQFHSTVVPPLDHVFCRRHFKLNWVYFLTELVPLVSSVVMCELYSSWYWIWGFSSWNHVGCLIYSGEVQECINPTCIYKAFFQAHSLPTWACIIWLLWSTTVATHNMPWYPTGHGYSNMTNKGNLHKGKTNNLSIRVPSGIKKLRIFWASSHKSQWDLRNHTLSSVHIFTSRPYRLGKTISKIKMVLS